MRDLFDDIFAKEPIDPVEAVRRATRLQLRKRFYQRADIAEGEGEVGVVLDGKPVRTPGRRVLGTPTRALAQALADEWELQRDVIDPANMPLTRLANSIIDGVTDASAAVRAEVEKYLATDLVLYRAEGPQGLVARQTSAWDPVIVWIRETGRALRARTLASSSCLSRRRRSQPRVQ